jgi:thioredoxin reductase (NADPH)
MYDVIIIGAGPIGLACGIEAKKANLSYLILEKGCLVNSIYNYPSNMVFFSSSERLEIGGVPFISHGIKPTRTEALEYYRRVKSSWGININVYEKVISIKKEDDFFVVSSIKESYKARFVIIAIGFYDNPNMMKIPGEELPKVKHYYEDAHPYADQKIIVVGSGNSAVDVALETYRRGADVTMVLRKDKLDDGVKYWVRPDIENRINEGAIKTFFNSEVIEITDKEAVVKTQDAELRIENDFIFAMTGYHPDFDFLKKCGISFMQGDSMIPVYNEENFESNAEGIFMAGVVCGGMETGRWFIENSRYHAENIIKEILRRQLKY